MESQGTNSRGLMGPWVVPPSPISQHNASASPTQPEILQNAPQKLPQGILETSTTPPKNAPLGQVGYTVGLTWGKSGDFDRGVACVVLTSPQGTLDLFAEISTPFDVV